MTQPSGEMELVLLVGISWATIQSMRLALGMSGLCESRVALTALGPRHERG